MQTLEPISAFQPLFHIEDIGHQFVILLARFDLELWWSFFDRAERFDYQHGMMRDRCAAAFAHDRRMRDTFGVAHVHDVPHHIVRVFLERVVG